MEPKIEPDLAFFYLELKINKEKEKDKWEENIPYPDESNNQQKSCPQKQERHIYFDDLPFGLNYWSNWVESLPSEH